MRLAPTLLPPAARADRPKTTKQPPASSRLSQSTMYALTRILNWGGLASVALGGLLSLVGLAKGKEARQLESVTQVTSLAGAVTGYVLNMTPGGALAEQAALPPLAALKSLLAVAPLLVAISGRVWSNKPLKGELSDEEAAIVQVGRTLGRQRSDCCRGRERPSLPTQQAAPTTAATALQRGWTRLHPPAPAALLAALGGQAGGASCPC